jgi:undecaprenyl-diphosphatase
MLSLNQSVFQFIHQFAGRNFLFDDLGIFFAQYLPYLMVAGFLLLAYYEKGWRKKLYVFAEGAIAVIIARGIVTEVIRFFYHHERPFSFYNFPPLISEAGWSFPSGHAAWFFALAMTVWYVNRKWGIWYFALATLMGIARVYAGVHWPLDIIGGIAVGIASGFLVHWFLRTSREGLYHT